MTEAEWLTATESIPLLNHIREQATDRKLRLLAVGCCRRLERLGFDPDMHESLLATERFADGSEKRKNMVLRGRELLIASNARPFDNVASFIAQAVIAASRPGVALDVDHIIAWINAAFAFEIGGAVLGAEAVAQAALTRDIFGNPFQPFVVDPSWLTSTVITLAEAIYADRAFDRLPILADALQDAGCEDADILGHLRGDGPHVRGCWALDLVLGRE